MRLLFCIKALSSLGGGAERVFSAVVNGLAERGHDISVLTFEPAGRASFYPLDAGTKRYSCAAPGADGARVSLRRLRRSVCALRPDVTIGFMPSSYVPLAFSLVGTGIPVIASEHNVPARYRSSPIKWHLMKIVPPFVRAITAVSEQMRSEYPAFGRRKMVAVPNPIFAPSGKMADVLGDDGGRTLIAVGRLHQQKDHLTLVRAFGTIAGDHPEWKLRILGDGDQRPAIENEVRRLGLEGRIALPGTTSDISSEYLSAQLYVISSRYESHGLATSEAFAHGLPAVGFADCPGTNTLIQDGENGRLVDPGRDRVGALANALAALMGDAGQRQTLSGGAARSLGHHDIAFVLDRWEDILRQYARTHGRDTMPSS